jgi:hypothetical protein
MCRSGWRRHCVPCELPATTLHGSTKACCAAPCSAWHATSARAWQAVGSLFSNVADGSQAAQGCIWGAVLGCMHGRSCAPSHSLEQVCFVSQTQTQAPRQLHAHTVPACGVTPGAGCPAGRHQAGCGSRTARAHVWVARHNTRSTAQSSCSKCQTQKGGAPVNKGRQPCR